MVSLKPSVCVNWRSNENRMKKKEHLSEGEGHRALIASTGSWTHQMGNGVQEGFFFNYYFQPLFDHLTSTPDEVMLSRMNSH